MSDAETTPLTLDDILIDDTDGLLDAPEKPKKVTSSDRLERAFLEIVEFRRAHDRIPSSTTREIGERKLGARLDGILANDEKVEALKHLDDDFALLEAPEAPASLDELLDEDDFDLLEDDSGILDVSDLPVRKEPDSPHSVAKREKAAEFEKFEHLFTQKHAELADGTMSLAPFKGVHTVQEGRFFVLGGVLLFVAEIGEKQTMMVGGKPEQKQRLRVIFENGTESAMYRQSLSIRLHEQQGLALVTAGDLDTDDVLDGDVHTGHVYVLQSLSGDPQIAGISNLHKIGFTTTTVAQRTKNAEKSPTYLMAPVRIIEDYALYNVKASALEHLLHRVFAEVRLDVSQVSANGASYDATEWFVVPRQIINQAIAMIGTGEIVHVVYDVDNERLVERGE